MIGLLVAKIDAVRDRDGVVPELKITSGDGEHLSSAPEASPVVADAVQIIREAGANGTVVSQRSLAAMLRGSGHHFSNDQLREISRAAHSYDERLAA